MAEERETQQGVALDAPFEHLATKEDVANVRVDIAELRGESNTQIAGVRTEIETVRTEVAELRGESNTQIGGVRTELKDAIGKLSARIESVRSELKEDIAAVDKNVESIRAEMRTMKWMMGIVVAAVLVQLLERFFI